MNDHTKRKKVIMACGTGKTIIMIKYLEKIKSKKVIILFPSLQLISQVYDRINRNLKNVMHMF